MNLRSKILQTGALAFCISVIVLSLTGYSVLEIVIISFIAFVIVTLLATAIVSLFLPPPKENDKKEDQLSDNTNILENVMNNDKLDSSKSEPNKDRKEEPVESNTATAKE